MRHDSSSSADHMQQRNSCACAIACMLLALLVMLPLCSHWHVKISSYKSVLSVQHNPSQRLQRILVMSTMHTLVSRHAAPWCVKRNRYVMHVRTVSSAMVFATAHICVNSARCRAQTSSLAVSALT
jgi:hypothetical protein